MEGRAGYCLTENGLSGSGNEVQFSRSVVSDSL